MLNNEAFGAFVCAAVTFLSTAFVEIGIRAIFITAQNVRSIVPELIVGRASEHAASALLIGTSFQIHVRA
jgi:hypothetical protein